MKFSVVALSAAAVFVSVNSRPTRRAVDPGLVIDFGVAAGTNPTGTGDCDGINGIKIPCSCPPPRDVFLNALNANIAAGHAVNNPGVQVSFPTGDSKGDALARMHAFTVALQNLNGPGVGCPQAATNWGAVTAAIQNGPERVTAIPSGGAPPPPPPPPPAAAPPPPPPAPAAPAGVRQDLVPDFGVQAGVPFGDGSADCRGLNNARIPCSCPPPRGAFIDQLNRNVAAGHIINNPGVQVSFPTGNSKGEQQARINALLTTLQNLNGPGVGCPAVASVYGQLQQQINGLPGRRRRSDLAA